MFQKILHFIFNNNKKQQQQKQRQPTTKKMSNHQVKRVKVKRFSKQNKTKPNKKKNSSIYINLEELKFVELLSRLLLTQMTSISLQIYMAIELI